MVASVNTTFTGPDRAGRYVALTDRYVISVRPDADELDPNLDHSYLTASASLRQDTDWEDTTLAVTRDVLPLLAGLVDGDVTAAAENATYSPTAGCPECGCTPGVELAGLTFNGRVFGVFVNPRPGTTN